MSSEPLRILIVEDHAELSAAMAAMFEANGHRVDFAADGATGVRLALAEPPDVVVLDLGLPGMDGLRVCAHLRERADRHIPILMLTARDTLDDKLRGFEVGADDYLVKPFAGKELLARCLALSRRSLAGASHRLRVGTLELDRRAGIARRQGRRLDLAPAQMPWRILLALAEAWPRTLTRSELVARLWGDEAPDSDPLRSHLYLLRRALDRPFATPMLKAVHNVGYRLEADA